MRLEPLAVYILEFFGERRTAILRLADIIDACTHSRRDALKSAVFQLSEKHGLVRRRWSATEGEMIELTKAGRAYVGLAAADTFDHVHTGASTDLP